jgi:hypothetical protein
MKKVHLLSFVSMIALAACGSDGSGDNGTGGQPGTGGKSGTGGASSSGGRSGSGGAKTGGTSGSGGVSATGGKTSGSGGAGTGGATTATGGAAGGGATSSGGTEAGGAGGTAGSASGGAAGGGTGGGGGSLGGATGNGGAVAGGSTGNGGAATGGATGSGGASSPAGACRPKFGSGVNVAWFNYGADVPSPDVTKFDKLYTDNGSVGGHIVRWWFHTNGSKTPSYDSSGLAAKISDSTIADVKKIVDAAASADQAVVISLWSFNMLKSDQVSASILQANKDLLQKDANRQAYVDNVLKPLVTALKGHPGIYAWEAFNEPEGMINDGPNTSPWTGSNYVSIKDIQKCVNWFAAGVHDADPSALFTNGAWTFLANTDVDGHKNYYSDAELKSAGGKSNGTLDFYQVHYYDNWGSVGGANSVSPFVWPASHWELDKPLMIGEFWTVDSPGPSNSTIKAADLYTALYDNGYKGAWAWQYANPDNPPPTSGDQTQWPAMKTAMQNLTTAHPADLACK